MTDRPTATLVALVALLAVLGVVAPSGMAVGVAEGSATDYLVAQEKSTAATEIRSCTTITEPGEYVLADDVKNGSPTNPQSGLGACITIRADDVALRGNNHTVAANPGGEPGVVGVLVGGGRADEDERNSNVTVRNLTTTRWGAGVAVIGTTDTTLRNVSAVSNLGDGFFVENAPGVRLLGGTVRGSNTGVFVRRAPNASLAGLTVAENLAGISIRSADGATVSAVNASENSQFGIAVSASANVTVADSTIDRKGFAGVALVRADDSSLRNLSIKPESASVSNEAEPVSVYLNDSTGVDLAGVSVADAPGWALYATGDSTAVGKRVRLGEAEISFEARDVALDSAADTPPLPIGRQVVGESLLAVPTEADAGLSLSVSYDDAEVERASTTEESLSFWRFDGGEGWQRVGTGTTVAVKRNRASATFDNLSENGTVVALVGEGLAETENEMNETDAG